MNKKIMLTTAVSLLIISSAGIGIWQLSKNVFSPEDAIHDISELHNDTRAGSKELFPGVNAAEQQKILDGFNTLLKENKSTGELIVYIQNSNGQSSEETNNRLLTSLLDTFEKKSQIEAYAKKLNALTFSETAALPETERVKASQTYEKLYHNLQTAYPDLFNTTPAFVCEFEALENRECSAKFDKKIALGQEFSQNPERMEKIQDDTLKNLLKEIVQNGYIFTVSTTDKFDNNPWRIYNFDTGNKFTKILNFEVDINREKLIALSKGRMADYLKLVDADAKFQPNRPTFPHIHGNYPSEEPFYRPFGNIIAYDLAASKNLVLVSEKFLSSNAHLPDKMKKTVLAFEKKYTRKFFETIFYHPLEQSVTFADIVNGFQDRSKKELQEIFDNYISDLFGKNGSQNIQIIYQQLQEIKESGSSFSNLAGQLRQILENHQKQAPLNYTVFYSKELKDFARANFAADDFYYEKRLQLLNRHFPGKEVFLSFSAYGEDKVSLWPFPYWGNEVYYLVGTKDKMYLMDQNFDALYIAKESPSGSYSPGEKLN